VGPVLGIVINLKAFTLAPVGIVTTFNQMTPVLLLPLERLFFKRSPSKGALVGTLGAVAGSILLFL
jgi:drug/metabolite transporter (DMT)-like permease